MNQGPANFAARVVLITLVSVVVARLGVTLGHLALAPGAGYPATPTPDLFRFDAAYYLDIATGGYAYDGDPGSSPNIVFAPLFPVVVRATPFVDAVTAGFVINLIALALGVALTLASLARWFGARVATITTLAQVTSGGSYAFHAYYAESLAFGAFGLVLFGVSHRRFLMTALGAGALGAARAIGIVPALVVSLDLGRRARRGEISHARAAGLIAIALAGSAGYLGFVAARFGNPFVLLPEIQAASWRLFHPPTTWSRVASGSYLFEYGRAALDHALDIRTMNWAWTIASLVAIPAGFARGVPRVIGLVFASYALTWYALDASSEFLISAHRFAALMTPIFLGFARFVEGWPGRTGRLVLAAGLTINAAFALAHAACFNQGWWFYF